jgi:methyl-accepting chemotaxis protein
MGRTSIRNKMILGFLVLILIIMFVVGLVNWITKDFLLGQAISTLFALATGIFFGRILSNSLVRRINSLSNVAKEISRGDLSMEIPIISRDEIRDLEEVFTTMVSDLRNTISDMKRIVEEIGQTNERLSELVGKVLEESEEIDKSAGNIAKGSEEQTVIVQKTSINLENALNTMDEMVRQSSETVAKVNEAKLKTETGEAKARETLAHLEDVLRQMAENTQPIFRLASKVEKIKMFIGVMDEIAQKTDLLSLNASIEATRAGESGRGFALVADEIRSMAENSKRSSQEIRKMVEDILEDNEAVSAALKNSEQGINQGRETINGLVDTFAETLSGVTDISMAIQEIEKVTATRVKSMRALLDRFKELSRLANESFVSTQKTSIATGDQKEDMTQVGVIMRSLKELSEKMLETQRRFKLDESEIEASV